MLLLILRTLLSAKWLRWSAVEFSDTTLSASLRNFREEAIVLSGAWKNG
jgi:hypothetical protein